MKRTICACMFLGVIMIYTAVYAQKEEKITVTTYYPSPTGVYQTIRLTPSLTPPVDAKPGQLYYNSTNDIIMYCNKTGNWTNITAGVASNGTEHLDPISSFPGCVTAGDIYFNNITDQIMYYNKAGKWVSMAGTGYWNQSFDVASGIYEFSLVNNTRRRVGIGTQTPTATLSVQLNDNTTNERAMVANFGKFLYNRNNNSQHISISLFPNQTSYPSYLDSTSLISVPAGRLQLVVGNNTRTMSFNVGGYNSSATEVMTLSDPCNTGAAGTRCPRVGIGNSSSPYALFVDSNQTNTTPFGIRGRRTGVKSAIAAITPYNDSVWITYGCYLENNTWKHSEYEYPVGTKGRDGAAFVLSPRYGGKWWMYGAANLTNNNTTVSGWLYKNVTLWNETGYLNVASSRKLKENFAPLNPDEFLRGIDQLDVTRWNFKTNERSNTHIGPVAEDFNQIFNLGRGPRKSIYLIDEVGVSLAGIKALSGRIKAQKQMIKELKSELKYLESQLSRKGGL